MVCFILEEILKHILDLNNIRAKRVFIFIAYHIKYLVENTTILINNTII